MKVLFFLISFLSIFSTGIKPNSVPIDNKANSSDNIQCFGFSDEELVMLGNIHNQYLTQAYDAVDFDGCASNCKDEIIDAFYEMDIDVSGLGKTKEEFLSEAIALYNEIETYQFEIRNWSNHPFSENAYPYLVLLMEKVDNLNQYDDFVNEINDLKNQVNLNHDLTCFDRELLIGALEVSIKSAYLWVPSDKGGTGFYQSGQDRIAAWSWGNAVRGDITASTGYFMGLGVLGAAGLVVPGSNAAILGGWAISAAIGSALGGV